MRPWRVLTRGVVPDPPTTTIEFACTNCEHEALMPVLGRPVAQLPNGALVFDPGPQGLPAEVECPHCKHRFTTTPEEQQMAAAAGGR